MEVKVLLAVVILMALVDFGEVAKKKGKNFVTLGCYKDKEPHRRKRALKYFLGYTEKHESLFHRARQCLIMARRHNYRFFGIYRDFQCWGSYSMKFYKYGCDDRCSVKKDNGGKTYGVGGNWTNFVYQRITGEGWTSCNCNKEKRYRLVFTAPKGPDCPRYNRIVVRGASKPCKVQGRKCSAPTNGGWSRFGPWSTCNRLCGQNGQQYKKRQCNNPEPANDGEDCIGEAVVYHNCNKQNCPTPCSFDGLLVQLLNNLDPGITITNHLVKALLQVMDTIDEARTVQNIPGISSKILIRRLKALVKIKNGEEEARTILGLLLAKNKNCNYSETVEEIRGKIRETAFKKMINADGNVTLTFTIDQTATSLIKHAKNIGIALAGEGWNPKINYVLATFGERPTNKLATKVRSFIKIDKFCKALDNIKTSGKDADCPDPTFAGIVKAVNQGHPKPGSPMYVFTDSPPKRLGTFTKRRAIDVAKAMKVPVNFFFANGTGPCQHQKHQPSNNRNYKDIMKQTGGTKLWLGDSNYMKQLKAMISADLEGNSIVTSNNNEADERSSIKKRDSDDDNGFDIDDIAHVLTVHVSGRNIKKGVKLLDPNSDEEHTVTNNNEKTWVIHDPIRGKWKLIVRPEVVKFRRTVKVSSVLDIDFKPTFMRNGYAVPHPLKGESVRVKMDIPSLSRLDKKTLAFQLVSKQDIKSMSKTGDTYLSPVPVKDMFKIRFTGKTLSGFKFQRESNVFQPQPAVMRSLSGHFIELTVKKPKALRFAIDYSGSNSKTFTIKVSVYSHVKFEAPESVTVSSGRTTEIEVKLTAQREGRTNVNIMATSGDLILTLSNRLFVFEEW